MYKHCIVQILKSLPAIGIAAVLLFARVPGTNHAAHLALVSIVAALFLMRVTKTQIKLGLLMLLAVVALDRLAISPVLWIAGDSAKAIPLWTQILEPVLLLFVISAALSSGRDLLLPWMILLMGLPLLPAGALWPAFPVVCAAVLAVSGFGLSNRGSLVWLGVLVWMGIGLLGARSGCDVRNFVSQAALVYAGYHLMHGKKPTARLLVMLATALLAPVVTGWVWFAIHEGTWLPPLTRWGVNTNSLSVQAGLGFLLFFLLVRSRSSKSSWLILIAGSLMLFTLSSMWTLVSFFTTVVIVTLPRGRFRRMLLVAAVLSPVIVLFFIVIPGDWLPHRLLVSYLSRQFHWKSAILFLLENPLGVGIGLVHPMALGFVSPSPLLVSIPGKLMQHPHHLLLYVAEQVGLPAFLGLLVLVVWWVKRFSRLEPRSIEGVAGAGFLFLWISNSADLSATWGPILVAFGSLLGLSIGSNNRRGRGWFSWIPASLFLILLSLVWINSVLALGALENLKRGNLATARSLARHASLLWPNSPLSFEVIEELQSPAVFSADSVIAQNCPSGSTRKVMLASKLLAEGNLEEAENLLVSASSLDPIGVIPNGGARARVFLAMMANERGEIALGQAMKASLFWKEAAREEALGTVEYFILTGQSESAESLVNYYLPKTKDDPELRRMLLARLRSLAVRNPKRGEAGSEEDRFNHLAIEVEELLNQGMIQRAEERLNSALSWLGDSWKITMLRSKVMLARGDVEQSIAFASKAVSESGGADYARWQLIQVLSHGQRKEEAFREADLLVQRAPRNGEAWLLKGQTLLDLGQGADAKVVLRRALELGADSLSCGISMAQAIRMTGGAKKARGVLVKLSRSHPSSTWPLWQLAMWAETDGRLKEAVKWGRQALKREPNNPGCNVLLGRVLRKSGQWRPARRYLMKVVRDRTAPHGWRVDANRELDLIKEAVTGEKG